MDLKTVQKQLKADISTHQMLMARLKSSPNDSSIRTSLQKVQKHIAELGSLQKNLGKSRASINKDTITQNEPVNGIDKRHMAAATVSSSPGFVKLEPTSSSRTSCNSFAFSSQNTSTFSTPSSLQKTCVSSPGITVLCSSIGGDAVGGRLVKAESLIASQPLNLTSKAKLKLEVQHPVSKSTFKKTAATQIVKKQTNTLPKNLLMQSPMQIRFQVPITDSDSVPFQMLPPSTLFMPIASPSVLRIPKCQPSTTSNMQSNSQHQIVLSIAKTTSSSGTSIFNHKTTIAAEKPNQVGSFQKFRIVGTKITDVNSASSSTNSCPIITGSIRSSNEGKPIEQLPSPDSSPPESSLASKITIVKPEKSSTAKSVRAYAITPESNCQQKLTFLGRVDLVPRERAEKMRNRRYGRRRAVAHPVYSGGVYLSTTATDTAKRPLPHDLLNVGFDLFPSKRPRGRPKGSTSKRSFSPVELKNEVDEEYSRILQRTKPSAALTPQKEKIEDLCEVCKKPGEFLMCDTCSRLYHMNCLNPPLRSVPTGMWCCCECKKKIDNPVDTIEWPGLLSVVQSFAAFNAEREVALVRAREKSRFLKARNSKLTEQKKLLSGILKEKVIHKSRQMELHRETMKTCEGLTMLLENIRCAINKTLDTA